MSVNGEKVERLERELSEARREAVEEMERENAQGETCGRRMVEFGPWKHEEGLDGWRTLPNGDRTCTFCGSLHPDDLRRLVDRALAGDGVTVEVASGKNYKVYVRQPDVKNAAEGGIKFYTHHLPQDDELRAKLVDDINESPRRFMASLSGDRP